MRIRGIRGLQRLTRKRSENNPFVNFTTFHVTPDPGYVKRKDLPDELKKLLLIEED